MKGLPLKSKIASKSGGCVFIRAKKEESEPGEGIYRRGYDVIGAFSRSLYRTVHPLLVPESVSCSSLTFAAFFRLLFSSQSELLHQDYNPGFPGGSPQVNTNSFPSKAKLHLGLYPCPSPSPIYPVVSYSLSLDSVINKLHTSPSLSQVLLTGPKKTYNSDLFPFSSRDLTVI